MSRPGLEVVEGGDPVRRQAAQWFARLRSDDASESDRQQWRRWMDDDERHRAAYARLERLWSGFGEHAPHAEIALRLRAYVPMSTSPKPVRTPNRRHWQAVAASLLVGLAVAGGWLGLRPAPALDYATSVGERRSLELEDGTRVDLDTDSHIRVHYSGKARRIALERGRAFFRVAKEQRPLTVETASGAVRAVGTEFEVYRREHAIEVALFEGKVQLLSAPREGREAEALGMLVPGQKARFGARQPTPVVETVVMDAPPAWMSGRLVFDDVRLEQVVAEFNRYSRRPILLDRDALGDHRITGVFLSDNPEAFADALHQLYGIDVHQRSNGEIHLGTKQ